MPNITLALQAADRLVEALSKDSLEYWKPFITDAEYIREALCGVGAELEKQEQVLAGLRIDNGVMRAKLQKITKALQ
jgi:hypothetical protein